MTRLDRRRALAAAESRGEIADDMQTRLALMERVHSGEITLDQAQAELAAIKRKAKQSGKTTRSRFYTAHRGGGEER